MTLQTRLSKTINELEEIYDDCKYIDEKEKINELIVKANNIHLWSDMEH